MQNEEPAEEKESVPAEPKVEQELEIEDVEAYIAEHPEYGLHFIEMLIGPEGQAILTADGQPPIVPAGGFGAVPTELSGLVEMKS